MEKIICIYKITNKINGKIYIGQTWNLYNRWRMHKSRQSNPHIKNAFSKYGINNFSIEVCCCFNKNEETQTLLNNAESFFIEFYKSANPIFGYNKMLGGSNGLPSKETKEKIAKAATGRRPTEETRVKLSIAKTGKNQTEETKKKLSIINTGKKLTEETKRKIGRKGTLNKNYGKKYSKERCLKNSEAHKGEKNNNYHKFSFDNPTSKKVLCVETNKIYGSTMDVERELGFLNSGISKCCLGKISISHGYHWKYI